MTRSPARRPAPRGGILLEIVISMAIFVGAAGFALMACRDALQSLRRVEKEQEAIDLARSKMAELELGLTNLADLRGSVVTSVGSVEEAQPDEPAGAVGMRWVVDVETVRSEFAGLTLVVLTVSEQDRALIDDDRAIRFTLRQLVRLRDIDGGAGGESASPEGTGR